jgi:hypothetical protein
LTLIALSKVGDKDVGLASSLVNTGRMTRRLDRLGHPRHRGPVRRRQHRPELGERKEDLL